MTQDETLAMFRSSEALLDGHFQLTSGLHSPQYFQCAKVLQYPLYAEALCREIANRFASENIDVVVAPALGGIVVAQEVGRQLALNPAAGKVRTIFSERKEGAMQLRRGFATAKRERVLVCEDVVTTGGSVAEVLRLVRKAGGSVVGVACIVDRSGGSVQFENMKGNQFSVLQIEAITYPPEKCPLCKQGISIEKPGSRSLIREN